MAIPYPVNKFAPTNARAPEPTGICYRCGFYYKLSDLSFQWEWRGPSLANLQILVCNRTCLDKPQEQLRTIRIGPDPVPPARPSPTFYAQQSQGGPDGLRTLAPLLVEDDTVVELTTDDGGGIIAG